MLSMSLGSSNNNCYIHAMWRLSLACIMQCGLFTSLRLHAWYRWGQADCHLLRKHDWEIYYVSFGSIDINDPVFCRLSRWYHQCMSMRNHTHQRYKFYLTRCIFHTDFMRLKAKWNCYANQTRNQTKIHFYSTSYLWNIQVIALTPIYGKCSICGIIVKC